MDKYVIHSAYGGDFVITSDALGEAVADAISHANNSLPKTGEKTVQEVLDGMSEKKKTVLYALVGEALKAAKKGDNNE